MKKLNIIFACISCIWMHLSLDAQVQTIALLPPQPMEGQSISVIVETLWPSGGCESTGIQINTSALPDISITAQHELGFLTVICEHTDTVEIGILPASEEISPGVFSQYQLLYTAFADGLPQFTDTDTLFFSVLPLSTSIEAPAFRPTLIQLGGNRFEFKSPNSSWNYPIGLIDLNGKLVWKGEVNHQNNLLDFGAYPTGIYFLNYGKGYLKLQLAD